MSSCKKVLNIYDNHTTTNKYHAHVIKTGTTRTCFFLFAPSHFLLLSPGDSLSQLLLPAPSLLLCSNTLLLCSNTNPGQHGRRSSPHHTAVHALILYRGNEVAAFILFPHRLACIVFFANKLTLALSSAILSQKIRLARLDQKA